LTGEGEFHAGRRRSEQTTPAWREGILAQGSLPAVRAIQLLTARPEQPCSFAHGSPARSRGSALLAARAKKRRTLALHDAPQ
jgi:hypothetical protein